jgi:hypothetical protein
MRVLFDNGTPRGVAAALKNHVVEECRLAAIDAAVTSAAPGTFIEVEIPSD